MSAHKLLTPKVTATSLVASFVFATSVAATDVPAGPVSGTWDLGGSPYLVQGDVDDDLASSPDLVPRDPVNVQDEIVW